MIPNMAALNTTRSSHFVFCSVFSLKRLPPRKFLFASNSSQAKLLITKVFENVKVLPPGCRSNRHHSFSCFCQTTAETQQESVETGERPPFDINLAVLLAGFAFEAYTSPPENIGTREVDGADCQTVFLSEHFLREVYDGQLFIKLKKGVNLPIMDPWGTSDPYVVLQLDGQVAKSKVKWATKEPVWNEKFSFNIKIPPAKDLQIAAWDANLVTPHKRMGSSKVNLELLCDGNFHEVVVELEGMGGGGKIEIEVKYKSFVQIDKEKREWWISFMPDFLKRDGFEYALRMLLGSESIQARQFVESAFGQLRALNLYFSSDQFAKYNGSAKSSKFFQQFSLSNNNQKGSVDNLSGEAQKNVPEFQVNENQMEKQNGDAKETDEYFWKNISEFINQTVVQKLGVSVPEKIKWDGFESLKRLGLQYRRIAEAEYVESGLATPEKKNEKHLPSSAVSEIKGIPSSLSEIKKASVDLLRQTDAILRALVVLTAMLSQQNEAASDGENGKDSNAKRDGMTDGSMVAKRQNTPDSSVLDALKAEEMRALFSSAESAMEAWAVLATSLGRPSFIKSEFEKICFLDNLSTDTQVAIWRDCLRRRLVVAFRGTEQAKWKDLLTDLMLVPAGLNPERIGGDFKEELQVHSGFLSAYDSVRNRILSLIKTSIGFSDDAKAVSKWHIYVTGHSLGGALATLLSLELCSSRLVKRGAITVTMYNFGSPRVGNRRFAEIYNEKVKDSWRVVNHRDIIPTVPRLMGYCHVAQPVYLAPGDLKDALANMELSGDGYHADVIGEYTPDVLVSEFMKGEKELLEKILQAEINLYRSLRDGSALMQHMEDFYYISLLESVRTNYKTIDGLNTDQEDLMTV